MQYVLQWLLICPLGLSAQYLAVGQERRRKLATIAMGRDARYEDALMIVWYMRMWNSLPVPW